MEMIHTKPSFTFISTFLTESQYADHKHRENPEWEDHGDIRFAI